jgi:hypothetical protein
MQGRAVQLQHPIGLLRAKRARFSRTLAAMSCHGGFRFAAAALSCAASTAFWYVCDALATLSFAARPRGEKNDEGGITG